MAELYLFNDNGTLYGFTPTLLSKTLNGLTYAPAIMSRSGISLVENFSKSPVTFKFERTHEYAKSLLYYVPEKPVIVTIYRDGLMYWTGKVIETKANLLSIEISCDTIATAAQKAGLQAKITTSCRHALYSANCGVVQEIWATSFVVSNINSTSISLPTLTAASGTYDNGVATLNGQTRRILKQVTTTLTLSSPFTNVQSGLLKIHPGCAHTETACTGFNNLVNYGGFSRIPSKNPMGSTGLL